MKSLLNISMAVLMLSGSQVPGYIITSRNEVVAKVMFLLVCVILFTGGVGCLSKCMLGYPLGSDTPLDQAHSPGIWSMSGQYASYWNAFLLLNIGYVSNKTNTDVCMYTC